MSLLLKEIFQVDNYSFGIEWADGVINHYFLQQLQQACPCAGCESLRKSKSPISSSQVRALEITNVGQYALKIQFSTGCSKGIFTFAQLRGDF